MVLFLEVLVPEFMVKFLEAMLIILEVMLSQNGLCGQAAVRVVDLGVDSELGGKSVTTMVMLGRVLAQRMLRGKRAKKNSVQVSSA